MRWWAPVGARRVVRLLYEQPHPNGPWSEPVRPRICDEFASAVVSLDRIELRLASRAPGVGDGPCGPEAGVDGRCWPVVGGCRRRVIDTRAISDRSVRWSVPGLWGRRMIDRRARVPRAARRRLCRVSGSLYVLAPGADREGRGSVWLTGRGVWYRHRGGRPRRVRWDRVRSVTVGSSRGLGLERHTHALIVVFGAGQLTLRVRGVWGAWALAGVREGVDRRSGLRCVTIVGSPAPADGDEVGG